ncbi:protein translocase subunit secA [Desulforamulus putei DSM 12395]|uniref:Protein translocase subunit SecA n=1 Tax=Desulforamulus putei DSM 12395 TaxID=1121429 RepID=A0A1M4VRJ7_9FIRM|nr:preprotein translocase subunit SecA [Desulforamulus putei]SHE71646.1 protein translocase subunit secA [Desulforamulus putei DSM 12395]
MKSILKKLLNIGKDDGQIDQFKEIAWLVDKHSEQTQQLKDEDLKNKTLEFKDRIQRGESLDSVLPEAFSVVREAAARVLGLRPFFVQVLGGIALHRGNFIEMKTGEGKTLTATMPVYLNALTGEGVHVVTTNEYLARRDSGEMGEVYRFLGLSVGCIQSRMNQLQRQRAYQCDITYGTNSEFGFDYLRDNLVNRINKKVQRGLCFAVIDEVDSILIDEARTPLIIADDTLSNINLYLKADRAVRRLKEKLHFEVDPKEKNVVLTEEGIAACEEIFGLDNLATVKNMEIYHHLIQALKAHWVFKKDVDYVVISGKNGPEVVIVDQFTGRLMHGRRYVNGLHQAIEAKEGVEIRKESKVVATITFQNYFRKYRKLAGMSGTLVHETKEFREIYGVDVVEIPTNKPIIRRDLEDQVFITEQAKWKAIVKDVKEKYSLGRPVLVGTINIWKSEEMSQLLQKEGIPHVVLNAKSLEQEAEIIARAGQRGAVTVATNMAGRGTDIKLGDGVAELGGLHVIGTTRHDARRIDDQLRGRAGRQGDPGSSCFYISMEDDLIRNHTPEHLLAELDQAGLSGEETVADKKLTLLVEKAQKRIENKNFTIRKWLLEFDDVMNRQRDFIYAERDKILAGENLREYIHAMIKETVEDLVGKHTSPDTQPGEWDLIGLMLNMHRYFRMAKKFALTNLSNMTPLALTEELLEQVLAVYREKETMAGDEAMRERERQVMLKIIDSKWTDHIDAMDQLRQGIGMRAYGQIKPIYAFLRESRELFEQMLGEVRLETVTTLFTLKS